MNALTTGRTVTTFTGRRGRITKLSLDGPPEAARVHVRILLHIHRPLWIVCRYHPADITIDASGEEVSDAR
jgi:hypothetical protein